MSINENVYGAKNEWSDLFASSYNSNVTRENRLLFANFGENQCVLGYAIYNNIIPNTTIPDKSLCFCGADSDCEFFKLTWYDKKQNKLFEETPEDYNNFSIQISTYDDVQDQFALDNIVYSPANNGVISGKSFRYSQNYGNSAGYRILTQIPFQNLVWLITVSAYSPNDVSRSVEYVTLKYYLEHYKNTYPNIYEVVVLPYTRYNANNNRSPFSTYNVQNERFFNLINFNTFKYLNGKTVHNVTVNNDGYILDAELYRHTGGGSYPYNHGIRLIGRISHGYESSYDSIYSSCLTLKTFGTNKRFCMSSTDENIKLIYKTVAYLGMFFTDDETTAVSGNLNSVNMYLGIIDENGITHGEYSRGTENENQLNYTWKTNNESPYNPDDPVPEKEKDSGDIKTTINYPFLRNGIKYYGMNYTTYRKMQDFLNTAFLPDDTQLTQLFKGRNPLEYITTVLQFPFNETPVNDDTVPLVIGGVQITNTELWNPELIGTPVNASSVNLVRLYDFGTIPIVKKFNDFRDYNPHTIAVIQLPFLTTYNVDLANFYGHNLSLKYLVDFTTGLCTALIFRDDLLIDTVDGKICNTIALSGTNQNDYINTQHSLATQKNLQYLQMFNNSMNGILNVSAGDFSNIGNTIISGVTESTQITETDYKIKNLPIHSTTISTASANNSFHLDYKARLIFYHKYSFNGFNREEYAKTNGFACCISGKINEFSGYTKCSNVIIEGINATSNEKIMIENILKSGFINNT